MPEIILRVGRTSSQVLVGEVGLGEWAAIDKEWTARTLGRRTRWWFWESVQ